MSPVLLNGQRFPLKKIGPGWQFALGPRKFPGQNLKEPVAVKNSVCGRQAPWWLSDSESLHRPDVNEGIQPA